MGENMKFLRSAVKEGLRSVSNRSNVDQDLLDYNKLKPSDFAELMKQNGIDAVTAYIKKMEMKRMKVNNG